MWIYLIVALRCRTAVVQIFFPYHFSTMPLYQYKYLDWRLHKFAYNCYACFSTSFIVYSGCMKYSANSLFIYTIHLLWIKVFFLFVWQKWKLIENSIECHDSWYYVNIVTIFHKIVKKVIILCTVFLHLMAINFNSLQFDAQMYTLSTKWLSL